MGFCSWGLCTVCMYQQADSAVRGRVALVEAWHAACTALEQPKPKGMKPSLTVRALIKTTNWLLCSSSYRWHEVPQGGGYPTKIYHKAQLQLRLVPHSTALITR